MAAKRASSKKRKKSVTRKKPAAKKKATRKKTARKSTSRKKTATKKKVSRKKAAASKKATRKKKATKKKVARKKPATKKKANKKKAAKKKVTKKKATKKKTAARKTVSRKKPAARKKPARKKTASRPRKSTASKGSALHGPIHGIDPYKPKRGEDYMSDEQLDHFREILTAWKRELMFEVDRTVHHMQDEAANFPDPNDRATQESEFGLELRTRDRERKLLRKIDSALARIDDGSYGYCDETGEEIGLKRLEARPVATLCLEAQERRELAERQFRDRDDRYR